MRKKIIATGMALLAAVTLAACGKSPDVTSNAQGTKIGDTIKIGVDMELTGPVSAYGRAEIMGLLVAGEVD